MYRRSRRVSIAALDRNRATRHNAGTRHAIAKGHPVRRKWLTTALKYSIGLALLAWVLYSNWDGIHSAVSRPMRPECFALAAALVACVVMITFIRWYVLVRAQDLPFTLRDAVRLGLIGYFFNTFLPGSVGGDLLKAAFIAREQERRTVAVSTVLIDRGVGLWGLVGLCAIVGGVFWACDDPVLSNNADLKRVVRVAIAFMGATAALWLFLGVLKRVVRVAIAF